MHEARGFPYHDAPMSEAYFGQPESCFDLVNQYGTYNIQPTTDSDNLYPLIGPGFPTAWHGVVPEADDPMGLA